MSLPILNYRAIAVLCNLIVASILFFGVVGFAPLAQGETCYNAFGDPYECGTDPGDGTTQTGGQNPSDTGGQNPSETGGQNPGPSDGGGSSGCGSGALCNPLKFDTITGFLLAIIDVLLILAVPIIIFFIIYAGYLFVTAQGNETKLSTAKSAFTWAVVGGVIVLGAKIIIEVIQSTVAGFQ